MASRTQTCDLLHAAQLMATESLWAVIPLGVQFFKPHSDRGKLRSSKSAYDTWHGSPRWYFYLASSLATAR